MEGLFEKGNKFLICVIRFSRLQEDTAEPVVS